MLPKSSKITKTTHVTSLMFPLIVLTAIIIGSFTFSLINYERVNQKEHAEQLFDQIHAQFLNKQANASLDLDSLSQSIITSQRFIQSARKRNPKVVSNYLGKLYKSMKVPNKLHSLSYYSPSGELLVRFTELIHPIDSVEHRALDSAITSGKTTRGLQFSKNGIYTQSCITPVIEDDNVLGYLEVERTLQSILETVSLGKCQVALSLILDKSFLNQELCHLEGTIDTTTDSWNHFPQFICAYCTTSTLTDTCSFFHGKSGELEIATLQEITNNGKNTN